MLTFTEGEVEEIAKDLVEDWLQLIAFKMRCKPYLEHDDFDVLKAMIADRLEAL